MANLFTNLHNLELNNTESLVIKYLAWCIEPIPSKRLRHILNEAGVTPAKEKKLLEDLQRAKKVIVKESGWRYTFDKTYSLPFESTLQVLWTLHNLPTRTAELFRSVPYYNPWEVVFDSWRDTFLAYASSKKKLNFPDLTDDDGIIYGLWRSMQADPNWNDLFLSFPPQLIFEFYDQDEVDWAKDLNIPDIKFIQTAFTENTKLSEEARLIFQERLYLSQYVYSGRIREIPQAVPVTGAMGLAAHALYCQYNGQNREAILYYQQSLKMVKSNFFDYPLYNVMYILALMADGEYGAKKKLSTLSKKRELAQLPELMPARLLIRHAQYEKVNDLERQVELEYSEYSPIVKVLVALLVRHYQFWENSGIDMTHASTLVNQDHLKLLQLEYSQDFPLFQKKAEKLKQELGLTPLLPPHKKLTKWENALMMLMDLTNTKTDKSKVTTTKASLNRIVYHIDSEAQITPRLQKSKDGVTWTKGRNIALSTFKQQNLAEMNETDRRLSDLVQLHYGGWGVGEYAQLGGAEAFFILAGYPLVFQAENPDMPIVITKEEPQIVITNAPGGYNVSVNVAPPYENTIMLLKENDQLYRVINLNALQRKVMETFHETAYFPITIKDQLAELLNRLSQSITIHSDLLQSDETLNTLEGNSLITVQLQPMGDGIKVELFVKPLVETPPYCKAGKGASSVIGTIKGKRVQAVRNLKKEQANFDVISRLLQKVSGDKMTTDVLFFDDYYQCLELIDVLREHTKESRTEWPEGVKFSISHSVDLPNLKLSVKGIGQWFEVDGELNIDERTQLKIGELLQKVRENKGRFIALNDSDFLALSQQLRRQLEQMDSMLIRNKKTLQISRLNTSPILEMEQMGVTLQKDKAFLKQQQQMKQAEKEKYAIPKNLQTELRTYQEDGFRWMSRLAHWGAGACLADDMGLGKTIQSITLLLSRAKSGASLVVAPASILLNWKSEIERFAPSLGVMVMHDADCGRKQLVDAATEYEVVLTTYGLLIKEVELLASKTWNVVILDEAHTIKNKETKISKAAMELRADFRLLLTGTPLQNHLSDIWNLFQFANPGLLGSFQHFNETFIQPIEKEGNKLRQKQLKKLLLPFLLRRTKTQVLDELPEKTEITLPIELSEEERALYENLRQQAVLNLEENSLNAMQALTEITRLRQAACHPALVNKKLQLASSKTQAFLKLIDELMENNHRALVFSQFTSHLALIRKELNKRKVEYLYLDGSVSVTERAALVKQFQTGEQPLFLISLKAGGTGLNLTAADYVIHLDPWWNPAIEDQASDRAHRIGQTRPVTIYRLIAVQTIEEKIIKLHQTKKSLADSLLDGSDIAHKLTKEEMLDLLRGM